jgi:hypothetical protein
VHIPFIEDKNTIVKELHNPDKKNVGQVTNINWERKTIYTMLDAFIGKKKLKDALSNVLHDVK